MRFDYEIKELVGFSGPQKKSIIEALNGIKIDANTEKFKNVILNHTYAGKKQFLQTSRSNEQVYLDFMNAGERGSIKDNIWQVQLHGYYGPSGVTGYTNLGSRVINLNKNVIDFNDIPSLRRVLAHEYDHLVGGEHTFGRWNFWTKKYWPWTSPYFIGSYFRDSVAGEFEDGDLGPTEKPIKRCKRLWYTLWIFKKCYEVKS